ncbi:MAG: hypothetical protein A3F11_05970 [Gammaproteobacteria bacterium RIFCSPHIGHO2_12_FULL_37_14]|nr:MAG: hypothetical protein A3F11_05970 [Gammaproteobacteria bacterium RIFCSPHIGHO2_12_FULL_37_14]
MTENLFRELEEKMMTVLAKLENIQKENNRLQHENAALKSDRENNTKRLYDFISLLDSVNASESTLSNMGMPPAKPILVQG